MITPPPVDPERWSSLKSASIPDRSVSNTELYRHACLQVGKIKTVHVLDSWYLFLGDAECTSESTRDILVDGLHFDVKGNRLLGEGIMNAIEQIWPDILPLSLDEPVAWHDKIDPNHLPESIFKRTFQ